MRKIGFLLLAACASTNALASEVGATFPQLANSTALMAVAIAETGASASLAIEPDREVMPVTQHSPLDRYVENAYEELTSQIEYKILNDLYLDSVVLATR